VSSWDVEEIAIMSDCLRVLVSGMFVVATISAAAAGQTVVDRTTFAAASRDVQARVLGGFVTRDSSLSRDVRVSIVEEALGGDAAMKELALSVVLSMVVHLSTNGEAPNAREMARWQDELAGARTLRSRIVPMLQDSEARVRERAVMALAGLALDPATGAIALDEETTQLLIGRYHADDSGSVRSRIVGGFGTDASTSDAVLQLIETGFADSAAGVRDAAVFGSEKLGAPRAIPCWCLA
jgi:HEAT repeat protein